MRTHTPPPDNLPSAFRVADALAAGVGAKRLRHHSLDRPFRGSRVRPTPAAVDDPDVPPARRHTAAIRARIDAYATVMPDHAFLVGVAAAVLHGIPVPPSAVAPVNGAPPDLSVGVWDPRTPPRRAGVRGVRVTRARAAVVEVEGIRVTSLADTWAMLAEALDEHDLVAAADHLLRVPRPPGGFRPPDRGPYCTREQLEAAIGTRRGAAKLRCALARARTGASSPQESKLRLVLVDDGLREPVLDHDVFDEHGRFVACVDLAYPELRLAIEYDGEVHRTQEQFERDVERLARLEALGWTVLRFTARHLREQRPLILSRVRAAVARAGR